MKKSTCKIILVFSLLVGASINVQAQTTGPKGDYDSLAVSNINTLINRYIDISTRLFNAPYDDSLRVAFNNLFKDDALVFRDYTIQKAALSPEEYVYYLNNFFGVSKPFCSFPSGFEMADLKYIPSGKYYVAKVKINKHLTALYDKDKESIILEPAAYLLQMEILATETERGTRFLGIRNVTPLETEASVASVTKQTKEKVVKPAKPEVIKPERIKPERTPSNFDNLVFLNWSIGSNLSMGSTISESTSYKITNFSYLGWQVGASGLKGISNRLYLGLGVGFHFGTINLGYENTDFSFEAEDDLNTTVDTYTRNVFLTDIEETIKFTNLNIQALVYVDLIQSENNKLLLGTGLSIGLGMSETSKVTASTNYTGTFHTINGQVFPEPFTLGESVPVPIYGFQTTNFNKEFDLNSKMSLALPLNIKALHIFDNNIFLGAGIESLIPLNSWLDGKSEHDRIFETKDDLNSSLASTISKSKRPMYFGIGISIGIQF